MTQDYADATDPRLSSPLLPWSLPSSVMIAAMVSLAFIAATFGLSRSTSGDAVTAPDIPSIGSITSAPLANGDRPFAFLEFDWDPAAGVPGFGVMPRGVPGFDQLPKHYSRAAEASLHN